MWAFSVTQGKRLTVPLLQSGSTTSTLVHYFNAGPPLQRWSCPAHAHDDLAHKPQYGPRVEYYTVPSMGRRRPWRLKSPIHVTRDMFTSALRVGHFISDYSAPCRRPHTRCAPCSSLVAMTMSSLIDACNPVACPRVTSAGLDPGKGRINKLLKHSTLNTAMYSWLGLDCDHL